MATVTNTQVFDFVGARPDVRTTQGAAITALIDRVDSEVVESIGRNIVPTVFLDVIFQDGVNCFIDLGKLYPQGIYRDIYSITSLKEDGVAINEVTEFDDGNDYFLDSTRGIIHRHLRPWSKQPFAILISGSNGLGGANGPLPIIQQAVIEMVAAKSGLWKQNVQTEGGTIESIRTTPSKATIATLEKYKLRDF